MPGLKELQSAFQRHVMLGDETVAEFVAGDARIPRDLRLAIYSHAYRARLVEALASDYEQLQTLMGEAEFTECCHHYIDQYPSTHFSLRWFGRHFPQYLGYAADGGVHDWPAEMAQLEWAFVNAFDAANVEVVTEADVATVAPEAWPTLAMQFHPSVQVVTLWWNTLGRWRAAKHDEAIPEAQRLDAPTDCLLWRDGLTTQFRSLPADEATALRVAMAGGGFADICGALAEELADQEQTPMQAAAFLKTWLAAGMISQLVS
jgi:hypothetical protein